MWSHSGKLKLPPGVKKPKTPVKSKRYIGKIMMLIAIARPRPEHGFDGKIGCWRITEDFEYSKAATYQGTRYEKGDTRRRDCTMDGDLFLEIVRDDLFTAIREKMPWAKKVGVQWDNASPHTAKIMDEIESSLLAPGRRGKQLGPDIYLVKQIAQSPES